MSNICFIGGIHGSGKGEICKFITEHTSFIHLTASEVLKWNELSSQEDKNVEDIPYTQQRLLQNLMSIVEPGKKYLLDGHYTLLNIDNVPEAVTLDVFRKINPTKLILLTAKSSVIKSRLEKRDSRIYSIDDISAFQHAEIKHAELISRTLSIPLMTLENLNGNKEALLKFLA